MLVDFNKLISAFNMDVKGVLHIGAHYGEEASFYNSNGLKDAIFFEPLSECFKVCKENISKFNYEAVNTALGPESSSVEMYTETRNEGQSSSVLKLHVNQYPDIVFDGTEKVDMITLDEYMKDRDNLYNLINIDVQGYELEVLRGATKTLQNIDYVYSEVNNQELYENCAMVEDLDYFLDDFGFARAFTHWAGGSWGDALYIKIDKYENKINSI